MLDKDYLRYLISKADLKRSTYRTHLVSGKNSINQTLSTYKLYQEWQNAEDRLDDYLYYIKQK